MRSSFTKRHRVQAGFSLLEMMFATVILLIGLVAVAQLVPASILMNNRNRTDSASLVFAQRELDQFLDQPLNLSSFTDVLGNTCFIGDTTSVGTPEGNPIVLIQNQPVIDFSSSTGVANFSFVYQDPNDTAGTTYTYDVRWAVITYANGTSITGKRFILGVRQQGGNGYFQPVTLDTMVER